MQVTVETDGRGRISFARKLPGVMEPGQRYVVEMNGAGVIRLIPVVDIRR